MKKSEFLRIREFKEMESMIGVDMVPGDKFLRGEDMIEQKNKKMPGTTISYYEVIDINDKGGYLFTNKIETLEED